MNTPYPKTGATHQHRTLPDQTGQSLVELALVIPILLILAIGVFDLGRVFFATITISNVSRVGARYLTLYPRDNLVATKTCADGFICSTAFCCTERAALQEAQGGFIPLTDSNVNVTLCFDTDIFPGCDSGMPVRVTTTYAFEPIMSAVLPGSLPLSRSTEMLVP